MNIQHINERYFGMSKEDALHVISQCDTVIGILERKWERPHSAFEAAILQTLLNIRETVRRAYDREMRLLGINGEYCWNSGHEGGWTCEECRLAITLPAFFSAMSWIAWKMIESAGEA